MSKPRLLIIATGGTIASAEGEGGALVPQLTGEQLAGYVPQVYELARIDILQLMNIDSTNMRPTNWQDIATAILERYDGYDGFVVLHGTDTMSYTAAALSYLIQDSPRPIVLTGSQQPMSSPFTDARLNLYQSVLYAADPESHDVSLVFGGKVVAGTRARKQRTMSFNAFTSVNYPELALIRNDRIIRTAPASAGRTRATRQDAGEGAAGAAKHAEPSNGTGDAGRPVGTKTAGMACSDEVVGRAAISCTSPQGAPRPKTYHELNERVFVVKLVPGINPAVFEALAEHYDAIILETFGIGGIPSNLQEAIFGWVESGRTLVVTTQVPEEGLDLGVYEVGRPYSQHPGILKGADMTYEALVVKTMWALGQSHRPERIRELFYRPINHDRLPE